MIVTHSIQRPYPIHRSISSSPYCIAKASIFCIHFTMELKLGTSDSGYLQVLLILEGLWIKELYISPAITKSQRFKWTSISGAQIRTTHHHHKASHIKFPWLPNTSPIIWLGHHKMTLPIESMHQSSIPFQITIKWEC